MLIALSKQGTDTTFTLFNSWAISKANFNSDGYYAWSSGYVAAYKKGMLYYLEQENKSNAYFSCMMFPMVMKKQSSLWK